MLTQDPGDLQPILPDDPRVRIRASRGTIAADHCRAARRRMPRAFPLLVTTADHALLDPAMVAEFTARAEGADLAIGVVESRPLLARFPHTQADLDRFQGRRATAAPICSRSARRRSCRRSAAGGAVEQDRKKGWRLLAALGPALLLGAVFKLRTIHDSAAAIGRKLGIDISIVEMSNPLAAIDVDKPADHALVEAIIAGRA